MKHLAISVKLLCCICSLLLSGSPWAQTQEYRIKAGFIYNFARFSSLMDGIPQHQDFLLCSSDANFIEQAAATLSEREIKGHKIISKIVQPNEAQLDACHTLFISQSSAPLWQDWLNQRQAEMMLIVGETKEFLSQGGHISFFLAGTKVRFEVSPEQLKSANIQISSKVLRLGRIRGGA